MSFDIEKLTTFLKDTHFIYGPEPEIYGGVSGFFTYGPLGKILKNNVENSIREIFEKHDMWEVECPTVMPSIVWKASGHLGSFSDAIIDCSKCKSSFRVDKLIEEKYGAVHVAKEDFIKFMKKKGMVCPKCKKDFKWEIKEHPLMMKTIIGSDTEAYNRPETATTTYLPYPRYLKFFRDKIPFGVFQIGKAYRNELSPRQSVMRGREFTQAEGQIFILNEDKNNYPLFKKVQNKKLNLLPNKLKGKEITCSLKEALQKGYLKNQAYAWTLHLAYELFIAMGISKKDVRFRQHREDEKAFYAEDAWDLEVNIKSLGWYECCGIHDRKDYDLTQHSKFSGKKLHFQGQVPHILEIAFGTDRPCFALLDNAFVDDKKRGNKILKLNPKLAPVKVAVLSLIKKLKKETDEVHDQIKEDFKSVVDHSGSVGKRYARADESGVPYCVTFDFDSLKDKAVTIRDRNSAKQRRVKIKKLNESLNDLIYNQVKFNKIGKEVK